MNKQLEQLFTQLDADTQRILASIENLSNEKINRKPQADKWSIAQVLLHLILVEESSLAYMSKKMQFVDKASNIKKIGLKERLRYRLLQIAMRLPFKFKAPKVAANVPETANYTELVQRWTKARAELKTFVNDLPVEILEKTLFKHPIAGRTNVYQAVGFFTEHQKHHEPQIKKML